MSGTTWSSTVTGNVVDTDFNSSIGDTPVTPGAEFQGFIGTNKPFFFGDNSEFSLMTDGTTFHFSALDDQTQLPNTVLFNFDNRMKIHNNGVTSLQNLDEEPTVGQGIGQVFPSGSMAMINGELKILIEEE